MRNVLAPGSPTYSAVWTRFGIGWECMGASASTRTIRRRRTDPATPLTEQAYRGIKQEILSNRLPPGAPLPVDRFIREMKLSRTPVREAILRLEREGFVEIRPRLGTFVAQLDLRKIREMYHVRGRPGRIGGTTRGHYCRPGSPGSRRERTGRAENRG